MAEAVSARVLTFCLVAMAVSAVQAQDAQLPDPTRPPAQFLVAPGEKSVEPPPSPLPRLQSVLISTKPDGRRVAVIDGVAVQLGSMVGDARLIEISSSQAVLLRNKERLVLLLHPTLTEDAAPVATK